jgi:DNA-binding response OmpR family regulator
MTVVSSVDLGQRRILVVEDEFLLSLDIVDEIEDHNGIVLGPVVTLGQGLIAFRELKPDACILNIRLGPEMVYELADELVRSGVPFIFASSESRASLPERFARTPLFTKPFRMVEAAAGLMGTSAQLG